MAESKILQEQEVEKLKSVYMTSCHILKDIGEFSHIVDIKLPETDVVIKFQLEGSYPNTVPHMYLRACSMNSEIKDELTKFLNSEALKSIGSIMISDLVKSAQNWLSQKNIKFALEEGKSKKMKIGKKPKKRTDLSTTLLGTFEEDIQNEKMAPMKTADDVISRILWDDSLPSEDFVIGYMDRHIGVVEKAFTAFSWEDLASVDYNTLAIPKHRIEYFKYKKVKVWEKKTRRDDVFGSTGNGVNIHDVIREYNETKIQDENMNKSQGEETQKNVITDDADCTVIGLGNTDEYDSDEFQETKESISLFRGTKMTKEQYFGSKIRPTHFLALRINNPEIVSSIQELQDMICNVNLDYHQCLIPPNCFHITLACLGLDSPEQTEHAAVILESLKLRLSEFNPVDIFVKVAGTGHFFHSVLYANVDHEPSFMDFAHFLRNSMESGGVEIRDIFDFNPHITVLKLDSSFKAKSHTRYLDAHIYDLCKDKVFGKQALNNIHLCEMSKSRQADGFYVTYGSIKF